MKGRILLSKHSIHLHHVFADDNLLFVLYEDVNELVVFFIHSVQDDARRFLSRLFSGGLTVTTAAPCGRQG